MHLRSYGRDVIDALDEAIALAKRADMPMHIAHLQCRGAHASMERLLERIDKERSRGAAITCDVYPYVAVWIDLISLLPPAQVRNLYIGPLDFAPTGAAISMARLDRPDDPRFPRLRMALAQAQVAELQPGDAIYIPPLWWHHVESLQRINALVNYWWKPVLADGHAPDTALGCLMHCILAFRSLPSVERAAWRELLDYYVFGDEDPAAHLPAGRRGILGPLTPGQLAGFRASIRRYL